MHGGHIKVKSSLNKGSTFVVYLAVETKKTKP
jgi:signal transduction histidine kinase